MPRPGGHEGAPCSVEREAAGGGDRFPERERRGARDPEGRDRLEGEEAEAEAGPVAGAPQRKRQLVLPALRHLPTGLRERQAEDARLAERGEQGERRGRDQRGAGADQASNEAKRRSEHGRRDESCEREEGDCEPLTEAAPAHGGSEGLDHGEASGRPGARDTGEQSGRRERGRNG